MISKPSPNNLSPTIMWYEQPFRNSGNLTILLRAIRKIATFPIHIMEVCGGQTYALSRYRIEDLLPKTIQMIHGPGCPVCVTAEETVARAIEIARFPGTIFCTFGDMMRVPSAEGWSLQWLKAEGKDIRMLYSPLDALEIARENPGKEVVFLAIGFETTTPIYTLLLQEIIDRTINNLSLLTSLFTIPAAVSFLARDPECQIECLLAAGHVCSITGTKVYEQLSHELNIPIAITGFEPADLLYGIYRVIQLKAQGKNASVNAYRRAVPERGNEIAQAATNRFFMPYDAHWRGLGTIPAGGLKLRPEYEQYDARNRFPCNVKPDIRPSMCHAGEIMKGKISPRECPLFGSRCTPDTPLGASMVSSEGACAAFYRYNTN